MSFSSPVNLSPGRHRSVAAQATFLFTDIEGSTELARRVGQERWYTAIGEHHRIVGNAITGNSGSIDRTEGDAFVAIFSDADAALAAATQAQRELAEHKWPEGIGALRVRMGLHTGVVVPHKTGYLGLDAHLAARVATAANGGQILITTATARAAGGAVEVRDLGAHRLKDFPEPERLYHVVNDPCDEGVVLAPRTARIRPTNLPPLSRALVGRDHERAEVTQLLRAEDRQIVTLVGFGGIGKTSLAVAVGSELLDEFPGGVFLVRLAGVREVDSILPMIAEAVGVTGQSDLPLARVLATRLGEERTLLILDNFEQLTPGSTVLTELVAGGGQLRVLVASQVPLRVGGERVIALGPLRVEDAVALFIERARAARAGFAPEGDERVEIERICTRLDCMPLAIELAAARVGVLSAEELERRLERPLGVLTRGAADAPERHRSLRATIEWTHQLLDLGSRSLFARLGACAGAVPLTAVEAIGETEGSEANTLDRLEELVEFSFVRRREDRRLGIRFLVPQALRDFAVERLVGLGEQDRVRRVHAEHVAQLAHAARLWKWGASAQQRLALLAVLDEVRPAVAWARGADPELHARLCAALSFYWVCAGVVSEVAEELRRALEGQAGPAADRAWILTLLAKAAQLSASDESAGQLTEAAIAAWRSVDDELERGLGLGPLSWVLAWEGRAHESIAAAQDALAILRRSHDRALILRGLVFLMHGFVNVGDVDAAEALLREADELAGGDPVWELAAIHADCAHLRGDYLLAVRLYGESLAWTSTTGESHQMLMDLRCVAMSLARSGQGERALEVGELVRLEEQRTGRFGNVPISIDWFAKALTIARDQVDAAAAKRALNRAREAPPTERASRAIELAATVLDPRSIQD